MTYKMESKNINTFFITEYEKLKDEQHKRIEFRDQMIYLTLAAVGGVFSFALEKPDLNFALLVLPFLCSVLGWTYLNNDEKISSIGNYIRTILISKIKSLDSSENNLLSDNWEEFVRKDSLRKQRKLFQLFVDLSIFCISSIISIISFFVLHPNLNWYHFLVAISEFLLILFLATQFIKYADIRNN